MVVPPLIAVLQLLVPLGGVHGTVRATEHGHPLGGVQVEQNHTLSTATDSAGRYAIANLPAGPCQLRFTVPGYASRDVIVLVPDSTDLQLDVELTPLPVVLPPVRVVAQPSIPAGAARRIDDPSDLGAYRFDADWQSHRMAGQADIHQAILGAPGVQSRGEDGPALHMRGGGGAENQVLLDGIPLFGAVHFAGFSSAVNPDAVSRFDVHTGVSSAGFGGRLSGVIELETDELDADSIQVTGALGPGSIRQLVRGPLHGLAGGFLLAARKSFRNLLGGGTLIDRQNGFSDVLGVVTMRLGSGTLRLVSLRSGNELAFAARVDSAATGAAVQVAGMPDDRDTKPAVGNNLEWQNHSEGVSWSRGLRGGAFLQTSAWRAGSSADFDWLRATGMERMHSHLEELGMSARVLVPTQHGTISAGVSVVRPSTLYAVGHAPFDTLLQRPSLSLSSAPVLASLFGERRWQISNRFFVFTGLRAGTNFTGWWGIEPRITTAFQLNSATRVGLGFGRTHQAVQSFLNEESVLGAVLGFDLPVAAGSSGVPIATADQVEFVIDRRLARHLLVSLNGYARRMRSLSLPSLSTLELFATDSVSTGDGSATGITGSISLERGPLSARASAALSRSARWAGATGYDVGFGRGRSWALDALYRLGSHTAILGNLRAGAGQPTSIVASGFDWEPYQPLTGTGQLAGTPKNLAGSINENRLPGYVRLDLGLRHSWRFSPLSSGGLITTAVSAHNVLNRENVIGLVERSSGSPQHVRGLPRGATFELSWTF